MIKIVKYSWLLLLPVCGFLNTSLAQKPNIIFLLADDMRSGVMGCEGNNIIQTPNLDWLAQNGVRFNNAFVTTSVCCCSRASILTGQYVAVHGINNFQTPLSDESFSNTYPMLLKDQGYQVGFVGKYGIGKNTEAVEDRFDYFWGTAGQPVYANKDENGYYIHYTDMVANHVDEFLNQTSKEKPFCLSVSFKAPHCEAKKLELFNYNPRLKDLYKDAVVDQEPTNTEEEWNRFPEFFRKNSMARRRWKMRFSSPELYETSVKGYYRLISGLDEVVGKVMDKLKAKGMDENTIIVFFSDNGFYLGEHGLAGKWYGHEESIRVPFIIYNPLTKEYAGTTIDDFVLNIDIAPTILSYAGIKEPKNMQGKDLLPLVNGQKKSLRKSFYYEHLMDEFASIKPTEAYRNQRYKYIIYPKSNPLFEEVYDLEKDKQELNNLALSPENKALVEKLRKEFAKSKIRVVR